MRAFAVDAFGERGSVHELPTPQPGEGEVLVRVKAASLNAFDWVVVQGYAKDYMEHRFPLTPGIDASGVIEAVGPNVGGVAVGDEVYAREGQVVLVTGATGGVGSFATQLLANRGARVLAVAREENADYARSLGADDTVDYTKGDLADLVPARYPDGVDAVVDHTGDADLVAKLVDLLRPDGAVVSVAGAVEVAAVGQRGLRGANVGRAPLGRLAELSRMVEAGEVRIPATKTYALEDAAVALEEQGTRHVRGKLVLQID